MDFYNVEFLRFGVAWVCFGVFFATALATVLSMFNLLSLEPELRQKLYQILVVEVVVICGAVFAGVINYSPKDAAEKVAIETTNEIVGDGNANWFAVVASLYTDEDLNGTYCKLRDLDTLNYDVQVYRTEDIQGIELYALSLGGYLTNEQAIERVKFARTNGIAKDAYPRASNSWGENLASSVNCNV